MKCPHCSKDIADKLVLSHAARIAAKRSRPRQLDSETAANMQAKSVQARRFNAKCRALMPLPFSLMELLAIEDYCRPTLAKVEAGKGKGDDLADEMAWQAKRREGQRHAFEDTDCPALERKLRALTDEQATALAWGCDLVRDTPTGLDPAKHTKDIFQLD